MVVKTREETARALKKEGKGKGSSFAGASSVQRCGLQLKTIKQCSTLQAVGVCGCGTTETTASCDGFNVFKTSQLTQSDAEHILQCSCLRNTRLCWKWAAWFPESTENERETLSRFVCSLPKPLQTCKFCGDSNSPPADEVSAGEVTWDRGELKLLKSKPSDVVVTAEVTADGRRKGVIPSGWRNPAWAKKMETF